MLIQYLRGAIKDLQTLISYTKLDIEAIKRAEHDEIFARNAQKDALVKEFETKKDLIDQEIRSIKEKEPQKDIQEIIGEEAIDLFGDMRNTLAELQKINSDYARMVFAVSEFFTSLMDKLIPKDTLAYGENKKVSSSTQSSLLHIEA
ncbi:hypothetical protein BKN38_01540 [Helicobacter sp. CLO-3]|uniref:flagellar export chaperone FlgN n=1 Tax=unclassified Helicobacter TaxID=2593540 RepID=UPI0008047BE5|nr:MULTISPECIES: flagellar export chaperone FlgN [unclassified Helicobacter]OBV29785.1 hypothetical protein BA723_00340 [Helicobacter sp. CLO-3]OHU85239.1 hypothetical protein BKN38_01540 [Helicobacter sp. CLO-3]